MTKLDKRIVPSCFNDICVHIKERLKRIVCVPSCFKDIRVYYIYTYCSYK